SATKLMLDLPGTIFQNQPFEIRGQLMLITDESIPKQPIEIYINGMLTATMATDKDGRFKLQQTWKAGTYTIRVLFHGTEHYAQSEIYLH
ncbi:MAG: hypothetical protein NTV30_06490, partial [Chloroflexi bacterium]|nr:hypothetical protein [Chloroflexota bacterium]